MDSIQCFPGNMLLKVRESLGTGDSIKTRRGASWSYHNSGQGCLSHSLTNCDVTEEALALSQEI